MNTTWQQAIILSAFTLLLILTGWSMAQTEKANDRLKRMEVAVAVCGDVAAYFAPDTDMDEIAEVSRKRVVRR